MHRKKLIARFIPLETLGRGMLPSPFTSAKIAGAPATASMLNPLIQGYSREMKRTNSSRRPIALKSEKRFAISTDPVIP